MNDTLQLTKNMLVRNNWYYYQDITKDNKLYKDAGYNVYVFTVSNDDLH